MAITEDCAGPHYHDRPHDLGPHVDLFAQLAEAALSPGESIDLIRRVKKEIYL